jgi:hypothetical protein
MLAAALPRTRRLQAVIPKKMLADILPAYRHQSGRQEVLTGIQPWGFFALTMVRTNRNIPGAA